MQQYNHEVETIENLRHLGKFRMKPPYRFGTHEKDPIATKYIKLEPSVLTIASSDMARQRGDNVFLSERHAAVATNTNAAVPRTQGPWPGGRHTRTDAVNTFRQREIPFLCFAGSGIRALTIKLMWSYYDFTFVISSRLEIGEIPDF